MKRWLFLLLLVACAAPALRAQSFIAGQLNNDVVGLSWSGMEGEVTLERRYPFEGGFHLVVTTTATSYQDTIPFRLCGDTIRYRLTHESRVYGLKVVFRDMLPTTMPELRVCTVDSASQRIQLLWQRSPDPDIKGYKICKRDNETAPWMEVSTVMGADRNSAELSLSPLSLHYFRIYAFDSCLTASAMTDPLGNMVLELAYDALTGDVEATWSDYPSHMVDGAMGYEVELATFTEGQEQPTTTYRQASRNRLTFRVPDGTVRARVTVLAAYRQARSNTVEARFTLVGPPPPPPPPDPPTPPGPPTPYEPPALPEKERVWIPNAFTPEESTNNRFCLAVSEVSDYQLALFDRLGRQIFHTDDPADCWEGLLPNGTPAPAGAYLYRLAYRDLHGSPQVKTGTVLLIR